MGKMARDRVRGDRDRVAPRRIAGWYMAESDLLVALVCFQRRCGTPDTLFPRWVIRGAASACHEYANRPETVLNERWSSIVVHGRHRSALQVRTLSASLWLHC